MPRKHRPLRRDGEATRDASLIIVASEDTYAVKQYFARFQTRRVQFLVIPTEDCRSAPQHVKRRLDDFKKEYVTEDGDIFWICIDRDRWNADSLRQVLSECKSKGHGVALSNPCFDLWMLLHFEDLGSCPADNCDRVITRLKEILGGYGKQCCRTTQLTKEMVEQAMSRARAMDNNDFLPTVPLTRVYKILEILIEKDRIVIT